MTNKTIEALQVELNTVSIELNSARQKITDKLQTEYNKVFENDKALQKALNDSESSSEYRHTQYGDIESWFRYSGLDDISSDAREYLETYCNESRCIRIDWDNSCFLNSQGGSIVINEDGDVYDSDSSKFFISKKDYESESELHEMIENHMQKTGYFPGVFRSDRYGNLFHVNTQKKAG